MHGATTVRGVEAARDGLLRGDGGGEGRRGAARATRARRSRRSARGRSATPRRRAAASSSARCRRASCPLPSQISSRMSPTSCMPMRQGKHWPQHSWTVRAANSRVRSTMSTESSHTAMPPQPMTARKVPGARRAGAMDRWSRHPPRRRRRRSCSLLWPVRALARRLPPSSGRVEGPDRTVRYRRPEGRLSLANDTFVRRGPQSRRARRARNRAAPATQAAGQGRGGRRRRARAAAARR